MTCISSPFPHFVSFAALSEAPGFALHPEEQALLSPTAGVQRIREFTLGRAAARTALQRIGILNPPPVLRRDKREPLWPAGYRGSITHAESLAAACVVSENNARGIGIDLESRKRTLRRNLSSSYCSEKELGWVKDDPLRSLLVFSAKETIYKALFPRYRAFFGFQAVSLAPFEADSGFIATLNIEIDKEFPLGTKFRVGWSVMENYVLTWTLLEP